MAFSSIALFAQNPQVTVNVDVQANRHPISPLIYGVNLFEDPNTTSILQDLNSPLNRYGGNRASTYNWQLNSDNRGNDNFFESISDDVQMPPGLRGDTFITDTKAATAEPMVTLPMLDWIARAGLMQPFLCSYPKGTFPNQKAFDIANTDCGNGLDIVTGKHINGADPNIAYIPNTLPIQTQWVQHIIGKFGLANGRLKYYVLDNEHDLWGDTHHDVVPMGMGPHYIDDLNKMIQYASMIKTQDPNALVIGPEISGWLGYLYSPFDVDTGQANNFADTFNLPDHTLINRVDYAPWLLSEFKKDADANNGRRLLDIFAVHYYPQGGDGNINTRSLWDPNFVDPSFINDKIYLIPRMKQWVAKNYPGTKIGITEYNWGAINDEVNQDTLSFAINEADVLGIFGREGLDLATRFNAPIQGKPTYNAMKMYRNYDGQKSTFGDVSTSTTFPDPDTVAAFSAQRTSDGSETLMLVSKYANGDTPVTANLANFSAGASAQVWQFSGMGAAIQHLPNVLVNNSAVSLTLPPQSITLLVISQVQVPTRTLNFSATALSFATVVGRTGAPRIATIANSGSSTVTINNVVSAPIDFSQTNNCVGTLAPGMACTVSVVFSPSAGGLLNGSLTITDDAQGGPHTISLNGTGVDFALIPSRTRRPTRGAANPVVIAGQSATFNFSVHPSETGGSTGSSVPTADMQVALQCSGLPAGATCEVQPALVDLAQNEIPIEVKITTHPKPENSASASARSKRLRGTARNIANESYTICIKAVAGSIEHSILFPVTVQ